jgi:uncharacterized membrane protein YgcG
MAKHDPSKPRHPPKFGHRRAGANPQPEDPTPSYERGIVPFLAKRSTAVTLVLAGGVVFLAYSSTSRQNCTVPQPGATPEAVAEYDRCRARHSSSSRGSSSFSSSSGSSSSSGVHSTATRGGFGSTGSSHASGG